MWPWRNCYTPADIALWVAIGTGEKTTHIEAQGRLPGHRSNVEFRSYFGRGARAVAANGRSAANTIAANGTATTASAWQHPNATTMPATPAPEPPPPTPLKPVKCDSSA